MIIAAFVLISAVRIRATAYELTNHVYTRVFNNPDVVTLASITTLAPPEPL